MLQRKRCDANQPTVAARRRAAGACMHASCRHGAAAAAAKQATPVLRFIIAPAPARSVCRLSENHFVRQQHWLAKRSAMSASSARKMPRRTVATLRRLSNARRRDTHDKPTVFPRGRTFYVTLDRRSRRHDTPSAGRRNKVRGATSRIPASTAKRVCRLAGWPRARGAACSEGGAPKPLDPTTL